MPKTTAFLFPPENTVLTGDVVLVDKFMQKLKKNDRFHFTRGRKKPTKI